MKQAIIILLLTVSLAGCSSSTSNDLNPDEGMKLAPKEDVGVSEIITAP